MAILKLFKSRADTMGYVFKSGKAAHFMQGRYATSDKKEIEELTEECEAGHHNFYIDSDEPEIDSNAMDPIAVLREKIRKEELAKILAATSIHRDMGTTEASARLQGIATSETVQGLMAGSEAQAQAANPTPVTVGGVKVGAITAKSK
jgi:hypothetical protein